MKLISISFLIYAFFKGMFYGYFEITEKENKSGGIIVIFLSIIGLIFPSISLLFFL